MSNYFLLVPRTDQDELVSRLGQLIELRPLQVGEAYQTVTRGDMCFASGESLSILSDSERYQIEDNVLRRGVHLMVFPPHPHDCMPRLIREIEPPRLCAAASGLVKIADGSLGQACGLDELTILYSQVICPLAGESVAITLDRKPVIVRYQHRSSWGQLLYTTLLLGSTSSRSQRSHRVALAKGLVRWLCQTSSEAPTPLATSPSAALDLSRELPILLMAVYLAQQGETLTEELLKPALDQIRARLPWHTGDFHLNEALARLEALGILALQGEGRWKIDSQRMTEEVDHMHLASYLRRLQRASSSL